MLGRRQPLQFFTEVMFFFTAVMFFFTPVMLFFYSGNGVFLQGIFFLTSVNPCISMHEAGGAE